MFNLHKVSCTCYDIKLPVLYYIETFVTSQKKTQSVLFSVANVEDGKESCQSMNIPTLIIIYVDLRVILTV